MTADYFRDSASSPEAYGRLLRLQREYFAAGDMTADRSELHEAVWAAYPPTADELEQWQRMKQEDCSGMWSRDGDGNWVRLP